MILAFSQLFNKKPTLFVQKIYAGLLQHDVVSVMEISDYVALFDEKYNISKDSEDFKKGLNEYEPKIHTIRTGSRWRTGLNIDFFINPRSKNMFRFAPKITVISLQSFKIEYYNEGACVRISIDEKIVYSSSISGLEWDYNKLLEFVKNDGFETVREFFEWFNQDFQGQIIHWTNKKY